MTHDLACAACLVVQTRLGFLFNGALMGSNHIFFFQLSELMLPRPSLPICVFGMSQQCLFDVFWASVLQTNHPAISHALNLPTWMCFTMVFHCAKDCSWWFSDIIPRRGFPNLSFPCFSQIVLPLTVTCAFPFRLTYHWKTCVIICSVPGKGKGKSKLSEVSDHELMTGQEDSSFHSSASQASGNPRGNSAIKEGLARSIRDTVDLFTGRRP